MSNRRLFACAAAALILASPAAALAASHGGHSHKVSGHVVSINAKRHILRLRLRHAGRGAHAAAAQGGPVIAVSFGNATVTGPDGAVAVGDDVTVTTQTSSGQTTVASSIQVIGQPSGGDAGKGAAVPGAVTAVDPTARTLTLSVMRDDAQGSTSETSVIVAVAANTILAVSDTNGDGQVTIADIKPGDHVVVFTNDATVNPMAAIGILDASHTGDNHQGVGDGGSRPTGVPGTVASVDGGGSYLTITVTDGTLSGQHLGVKVTPQTSFGGEDSNGDGSFGLTDIAVGDQLVVYTDAVSPGAVVAVGIVDRTAHGASGPHYSGFGGTVAGPVGPDSVQVLVGGDSPLAGKTVTVDASQSTIFRGSNASGGQVTGLAEIEPGDQVAVYTTAGLDTQPIAAAAISDRGTGTPPPTPPSQAPTQKLRFGGTVTDVRGDGLTVAVSSGGPLSGQTVIVSIGASTSFATGHGTGSGTSNLAYISVGDAVEIYTTSESASPIVAVGVVDDSVPTGSQSD